MTFTCDTAGVGILTRCGVVAAALVVAVGAMPPQALADTPDHPATIDLGPGNDDVARALKEYVQVPRRYGMKLDPTRRPPDLSGRDLRRATIHLELLYLKNVKFDNADLGGADIDETGFVDCSFRNAMLRHLRSWGDIGRSCDLTDADISGSDIHLTGAQLRSTRNYKRRDLSGIGLGGDFRNITFAGFNLRGTTFSLCDLDGCDFTDADITEASFACSRPPMDGVKSQYHPFTKEQLYSTRSYRERNLRGVGFAGCDLRGVDFSRQTLGRFHNCDLTDANFTDADFPVYQISFAADGSVNSRQSGFEESHFTATQFYVTRTYRSGRLPGRFALERMNLDGWDFSNMNLCGASFRFSSLKGSKLTDARGGDFLYTRDLTVEQVKLMWNYKQHRDPDSKLCFRLPEHIEQQLTREKTPGTK